ncbi:MAG: V-type ATPase subunit [bacterium]|nr:V-type ATPase subunit [bacterium]
MNREEYLYAAGVVRRLETKLLNSTDVERMVDAPDLEAAFRVFHDTDYYDNMWEVSARDFNQALEADLLQAKERLMEMSPDESVIHLLFMRQDFHNLKLWYKSKLSGQNLDEHASTLGNVDPQAVKDVVMNGGQAEVPEYVSRTIEYMDERSAVEPLTPVLIDRWCDRRYFHEYASLALSFGSNWIDELVALRIDSANLKTYLRGHRLRLAKKDALSEIVAEGGIPLEDWQVIVELPYDEGLARVRAFASAPVQEVIDRYQEHQSLEQLEKDLENVELHHVREAQYIDSGPELLIAYFLAKKNAIRNVRLIMTGKLNKIDSGKIKELVREIY